MEIYPKWESTIRPIQAHNMPVNHEYEYSTNAYETVILAISKGLTVL